MSFYDAIRVGASGAAGDFEIDRSIRYDRANNSYFSKQPSSAGNRRTFTISVWVKRSNTGAHGALFYAGTSVGQNHDDTDAFLFNSSDKLTFSGEESQTVKYDIATTKLFRDPSAWYHIVLAVDTTQGTASNRIKIYVNGEQQTSLDQSTYPAQNYELFVNSTVSGGYTNGNIHVVGYTGGGRGLDGYLAEYHLIDGQQLTPSSFAETNTTTGQWIPIDTSELTYGTNGFRLQFLDNSGTTATTLGKDSSGNGNNFTPNNFSVAAGAGNDSLEDTPTNNFPTLNPLYNPVNTTFGEGNLLMRGGDNFAASTFLLPKSGKWYVEFSKYGNGALQSISVTRANTAMTNYAGYLGLADNVEYVSNGELGNRSRGSTSDATAWTSDADIVVAAAVDMDNGAVYFARANTWQNSGDPTSGSSKTGAIATDLLTDNNGDHVIAVHGYNGNNSYGMYANFGQQPLTYTPPTGYKVLSSANLPDPTILLPNKHFGTLLFTGNGGTQSITDSNTVDFTPDWVWIKTRSTSNWHFLFDAVRGVGRFLFSNSTSLENGGGANPETSLTSFITNGFSLGADPTPSGSTGFNINSATHVAWNWNAGDTDGKTYTVTVVDDSGNKYRFDGFAANAVTLDLAEGGTYIFNYPSAHPFRFSTTADGTHGGGSEYTTGVTVLSSTSIQIVVAASAPNLNYYCSSHSGMGGAINTNSTLGSSNFDGTIQATAKVNATAGFSIVTYSGNGSSDSTIGHGLGVAPKAVIVKRRNGTDNWQVYWIGTGTERNGYLSLDNAFNTPAQTSIWGTNVPTSTKFYLGTDTATNTSGSTYVGYVFSEVAGYSKFGEYTGNGSSDGTFVFTGFRPAFVLIKSSSNNENWYIIDNKRPEFNGALGSSGIMKWLQPNQPNAENQNGLFNFLSNGFKLGYPGADTNGSGRTYIYFAFAESSFKNARAR